MKYFKQNNTVYAYDAEQLAQGYGKDMTPMTDEEVELHINPPKTAEQIEAEAKAERLKQLEILTVTTTSGKTFDGDETARGDMLTAITVSGMLGVTETNWKMADNTFSLVTLAEMQEALMLAIQKKGVILGAVGA